MKVKMLTVILAAAMLISMVSGCMSNSTDVPAVSEAPASEAVESAQPQEQPAPSESEAPPDPVQNTVEYPLTGDDLSLSHWTTFPGNLSMYFSSFAEQSAFIAAEETTGVHIDFQEASMQTASENFSVMVASGDYPDMISSLNSMYSGGATAALDDEVIVKLNDSIEEFAPDYYALLTADRMKQVTEDDGSILAVTGFYLYDTSVRTNGVFIRNDWLEDLGLVVPVTYDDWHDTLEAFKTGYGVSAPLMLPAGSQSSGGTYVGGYGTIGYEDLGGWDAFAQTCKDLGIDRCIEIRQDAYDRWLSK